MPAPRMYKFMRCSFSKYIVLYACRKQLQLVRSHRKLLTVPDVRNLRQISTSCAHFKNSEDGKVGNQDGSSSSDDSSDFSSSDSDKEFKGHRKVTHEANASEQKTLSTLLLKKTDSGPSKKKNELLSRKKTNSSTRRKRLFTVDLSDTETRGQLDDAIVSAAKSVAEELKGDITQTQSDLLSQIKHQTKTTVEQKMGKAPKRTSKMDLLKEMAVSGERKESLLTVSGVRKEGLLTVSRERNQDEKKKVKPIVEPDKKQKPKKIIMKSLKEGEKRKEKVDEMEKKVEKPVGKSTAEKDTEVKKTTVTPPMFEKQKSKKKKKQPQKEKVDEMEKKTEKKKIVEVKKTTVTTQMFENLLKGMTIVSEDKKLDDEDKDLQEKDEGLLMEKPGQMREERSERDHEISVERPQQRMRKIRSEWDDEDFEDLRELDERPTDHEVSMESPQQRMRDIRLMKDKGVRLRDRRAFDQMIGFTESGKFDGPALNIFSPEDMEPSEETVDKKTLFDIVEEENRKNSVLLTPSNAFEEQIRWTEEGKLWKFPIDNEQGWEEEAKVGFEEHVFLEDLLEDFPKKGPVRHFMELVTTALSKNPYLTIEQKREHIDWYRNYFEEKKSVIQESLAETTEEANIKEGINQA